VSEERTEKATPKKLKDSRKEGQVARTPEIGGWASMLVVAMMLGWLVQHGTDEIRELLVTSLALVEQPEAGRAPGG